MEDEMNIVLVSQEDIDNGKCQTVKTALTGECLKRQIEEYNNLKKEEKNNMDIDINEITIFVDAINDKQFSIYNLDKFVYTEGQYLGDNSIEEECIGNIGDYRIKALRRRYPNHGGIVHHKLYVNDKDAFTLVNNLSNNTIINLIDYIKDKKEREDIAKKESDVDNVYYIIRKALENGDLCAVKTINDKWVIFYYINIDDGLVGGWEQDNIADAFFDMDYGEIIGFCWYLDNKINYNERRFNRETVQEIRIVKCLDKKIINNPSSTELIYEKRK